MESGKLLGCYEELRRQAQQMLESARQGDWNGLIELERKRGRLLEDLASGEQGGSQEPEVQEKKAVLIRQILEIDGETRELAEAWLKELQEILGSVDTEQKLQKAYGSG